MQPDSVEVTNDYLHFMDDRYPPERTEREANLIWSLGSMKPDFRVLDVACGWGRITRILTAKGAEVVGLDNNEAMLTAARNNAPDATFVAADMRKIPDLGTFDAVVFWWSSFGIFDDDTDMDVLRQIRKLLRPGGKLILESGNAPNFYIEAAANKRGVTFADRVGDDVMVDTRKLSDDGRYLIGTREIYRENRVSEMRYRVRLFTGSEIEHWLIDAGFSSVDLHNRSGEPLHWSSYCFVAVATA